MNLIEESKCPKCKKSKVREPKANDPVFLLLEKALTAAAIEEILKNNGIPSFQRGLLGSGVTAYLGYSMESAYIYVPYGELERGRELLLNFFEDGIDEEMEEE
jgi:hypothetical protein